MRHHVILLCSFGLVSILGCEQRIPKEELGTVVFAVPTVGADKPPPLPELDRAKDSADSPPSNPR
jgi:hypothetical protein